MDRERLLIPLLLLIILISSFILSREQRYNANKYNIWFGDYYFCETLYNDETLGSMFWEYKITIKPEKKRVVAYIYLDGHMTMYRIKAKLSGNPHKINLFFDEYFDGNLYEINKLEKDDFLLSLELDNQNIYTYWGNIKPQIDRNSGDKRQCFQKTER